MRTTIVSSSILLFFLLIRPPRRSTLFPTRRSSDLTLEHGGVALERIKLRAPAREHALDHEGDEPFGERHRVFQGGDRKSTRLNSSHQIISYAVFCLKKKNATATPLCS